MPKTFTSNKKSALKSILVVCLTLVLLPISAFADVRLPHIFGSHMVLQAEKPIVVWGWADSGEAVTVAVADEQQQSTADGKGKWRVYLPAIKASATPITVTITGKNKLVLEDVLVGEVWLGSGQSNMEMGVTQVVNASDEIAAANYPLIRLFLVSHAIQPVPADDVEGTWKVCSPQSITEAGWGGFSATGYFFGRELFKSLKVPVGIIQSCWGGTPIEAWIPEEGFAASPALKDISNQVESHDPGSDAYQKQMGDYLTSTGSWLDAARNKAANKALVLPPPTFPDVLKPYDNQNQPTALYNGMIHPLEPFSMRGIIWYQGEANMAQGAIYTEKTRVQVESWRKAFEQPGLSYYYTLIAPFNYDAAHPQELPVFWEAQAAAMSIPNTGMIVTTDIGNPGNIHPTNKQEIGRRLSLWALAKTYGKSGIVFSGPTYQSFVAEGNKLRVNFDHADGLVSRDGKPLTCFEIADADQGVFVSATATIEGSSVVLTADGVNHPVAVRFCWNQTDEPNLANAAGLPAMPFRAGELPRPDSFKLIGAETQGYQLVYDLDLSKAQGTISYDTDDTAKVNTPFSRIAYLMELKDADGRVQYVWVSMDAFTDDVHKIGVPTIDSHESFQKNLTNMNVFSNVPGVVTGNGILGGNIEFWPNNYDPYNATHVPNASDDAFDFGDVMTQPENGYGSMQIHNHDAKQTIFAYNHWSAGKGADVGIGNAPGKNLDWTFASNASSYPFKRLRIYIRGS